VAPDHGLLNDLITPDQAETVNTYIEQVSRTSERQRLADEDKTGVFTGSYAVHPLTGEKLPIWIGNYVLSTYATGAVMGVPGHDSRDWDFATKYTLPKVFILEADTDKAVYEEGLRLVNSSQFDGMTAIEAKKAISILMVA